MIAWTQSQQRENITYPSYTLGLPDSMSSPGDTRSYAYDALARLEDLDSSTLDYSYSYDDVGNILTKTTEHGNYVYDYDDVYRLTDVDNPTLDDEAYTYDGVGNRETATNATGTMTHNANNELEYYGDISFDYDANGNMVSKTSASESWAYTYNVQNRLVQVEEDDLLIAEYGYDPFGRRLWKEVDGERTYFLYSDEGLVAEYDASGAEIRSYGYKPDSTWTTDLLWLKEGGSYYWYQNDHLGTPQKLVDVNGTVVWSAQYSSFGEAVVDVETVENNLRFPGQYTDAETVLYYNYFRYYDPRIGRYLRVDPIGFDGGVNLFSYSLNNPVNAIDVFALETAVIITKSLYGPLWIGDHAAVRIDFPGISEGELGADMPKLFDPGGGYYKDNQNKEMQGSAILGWYDSAEADLWPFIQYHLEDNEVSWVIVHYFETTPEEEACIFENMELADPGAEFLCAKSTYGAIAGCGPFSDLKKALTLETPGGLDKKLQNIGIPHKRVIYLDTLHMLPLLLELGFSDMLQFYQYGTLPGGVPIS